MRKKLMASVLAIVLLTSNFAYAAPAPKEAENESTRKTSQEPPKGTGVELAEVPLTEDLYIVIDKLLGQRELYKTLKTSDTLDALSVYVETLQGKDLYSFVVYMQHEFLFMAARDIKDLKDKGSEPKKYKETLDYALGQLTKWGTLLDSHVQNQPLDKAQREAIEKVLFEQLKEAAKEVVSTEKLDSLKSLRTSLEKSTGVSIEGLYEKLSCFRAEPDESQSPLERQRKAFQAIYDAYGANPLDQDERKEEDTPMEESLPEEKDDIPLEQGETKEEEVPKESNKAPDLLKKYTQDTITGEGRIKTLSVKSRIKEAVKDESNTLIEAASVRQNYTTFSVEAKVEGNADKVLLETWSGSGKKEVYHMKEAKGLYGVEISYEDSGVYDTKDGVLHYQLQLQDASGRTIETSKADSVKAYGGYLDGSYIGTQSAKTFRQKGASLDVWGSFAVSTTTVITGAVRIHGDSTLWLETQDRNPSVYLNGNTSISGDGPQSKVVMSRKLQLKDDAGAVALESGTATISNLSFFSEDNSIGGTTGKSHGIWGQAGTSLTIQDCRLSSRATGTIVGSYGSVYTQNSTFEEGTIGIHFNGSFGNGLEIRTRDCVFQNLNEGIQGGSSAGKKMMSLYLDGSNRFRDINRQAITVADGAFLSFASNSATNMERVGGGVKVVNFDKAALRNVNVRGRSIGEGLLFVGTPGEIQKGNIKGFGVGVQTQLSSHVKSMETQINGNKKGVMNQATYEQVSGSIRDNTAWGVHHAGDSFWYTGGGITGNSTGDVYLEKDKVIDWVKSANTEKTKVLSADKVLGTPLVRNQWQENGATADGEKAEDYFTAMHGGRYLGRGGNRSGFGDKRLVLSTTYEVTYQKNSSDQIGDMPNNDIKYWNERYDIPGNEPKNLTYSFIEFEGWDTVANGNVDKLPGGQLADNKNTALKAVWRDNIRVYYISNYGDDTEKMEKVSFDSTKKNGYKIQENAGFTNYVREDYTYGGFDLDKNQSAKNVAYKEGREERISFEEMLRHARVEKGILTLNIYAIWDKLPEIQFQGTVEFYEGTDALKKTLMANVTAKDAEDGDLTGKIKIVEIQYGEGKLDPKSAKRENVSYPDGMKENDKLDTWFMTLDKKKSPVSHEVVYEITDSAGGTTRAPQKVKVKYNEFPEIVAEDRYYTLEDAQNGKITEQELLGDALAEGKVTVNDKEEDAKDPKYMKDRLGLSWFDPSEFTAAMDDMMVLQEYIVKDSMGPGGTGKETKKRFKIFIRKVGKVEKEPPTSRIRGIDEENYRKNEGKYLSNLSPEEKEIHNKNGGLNVDSIWYRSAKHREMMEAGFRNEVEAIYRFDHGDVLAVQDFIEENGIGNSKDPTALQRFADKFLIDLQDEKENVKK